MEDLQRLDATAQAELVRRGEVSPSELVDAAIARAEAINPKLNALVTETFELAREAARGALPNGPFRGVPFVVKDLIAAVAGVSHTDCCRFNEGHVATEDSELVRRFKKAGLVVIGLGNASEFGIPPTTEPLFRGKTKNPWDPTRSPGGSSGGSAAAVASRIVPMAHANDAGGSIRIPASCCGLFGLKPTRARNSLGPDYGDYYSGLVCEHAITRSVRDSAALLDATAGPAPGDPYVAPAPERPFLEEVGADPGRLRIAFTAKAPASTPVHDDCIRAVEDAAKLCDELGHEVVEAAPELDGDALTSTFITLYSAGAADTIDDWAQRTGRKVEEELFDPLTWALAQMGRQSTAADYAAAVRSMHRAGRRLARFFESHDVYLTPTLAEPPLPLGTLDAPRDNPLMGFIRAGMYAPFMFMANVAGQPGMSVPLAWSSENLPIGVHFLGPYAGEGRLLRLAAQLESARPWGDRSPPISA